VDILNLLYEFVRLRSGKSPETTLNCNQSFVARTISITCGSDKVTFVIAATSRSNKKSIKQRYIIRGSSGSLACSDIAADSSISGWGTRLGRGLSESIMMMMDSSDAVLHNVTYSFPLYFTIIASQNNSICTTERGARVAGYPSWFPRLPILVPHSVSFHSLPS